MEKKYILKLYVAGRSGKNNIIAEKLKTILQDDIKDFCVLKIINILEDAYLASNDEVIATPTLAKTFPVPVKKIVGDLNTKESILSGFNIITQ